MPPRPHLLVATLALSLLAPLAVAQPSAPIPTTVLTEADNLHTLKLTVGQEVTVLLNSTPSKSRYVTTGPTGKTPVVYLGESYTPNVLGQLSTGGQQSFRFRATAVGQAVLRFSLLNRRSVSLRDLRYAVTVSAAQVGTASTAPSGAQTAAPTSVRTRPGRPVQLTLANAGKAVEVSVGSGLSLSLAPGGQYGVPSVSGPELERFGPAGGATGPGGQQLYAFRARSAGQVTLSVPVLDAAGGAGRTLVFTVTVR